MLPGYRQRPDGVIAQVDRLDAPTPVYDTEYVRGRYDQYSTTAAMSRLRLGLLTGLRPPPPTVLDFGYGNGSFLSACRRMGMRARGYDITGYPLPEGVEFTADLESEAGCITCFDSLEHVPDLDATVARFRSRYLVISVPWCHFPGDDAWFAAWKHRRPGEHLWHFDPVSLGRLLQPHGYRELYRGSPEDRIRRPATPTDKNILTMIFQREPGRAD